MPVQQVAKGRLDRTRAGRDNHNRAPERFAVRSFIFSLNLSLATGLIALPGAIPDNNLWRQPPPSAPAQQERQQPAIRQRVKPTERAACESEQIRAILAEKDPIHAAGGYRSLFKLVGYDGLSRLET